MIRFNAKKIIHFLYACFLIKIVLIPNIGLCQSKYNEQINLGSNINSKFDEANPVICPDGKYLYFYRANHPDNFNGNTGSQDIWYSKLLENGTWSEAKRLGKPFNRQKFNILFNVTPDNNTFLIGGVYKRWIYMGSGLSFSHRKEKSWSKPYALRIEGFKKINNGQYFGAYLSNDRSKLLLYLSEKKNDGNSDLYICFRKKANKWSKPLNMGLQLNSLSDEFSPCLASDNKTLYFSSNRKGGEGSADIYMSKRLDETWQKWSKPINLGTSVNSDKWEAYFSVDAKGEYAYLVSNYSTFGKGDIVKVALKDSLRPNPVALLTGFIEDKNENDFSNKGIEIYYKEIKEKTPTFEAIPDPITSDYKITLPLNSSYMIYALNNYYLSRPHLINLSNNNAYIELTHDINLIPIKRGLNFHLNVDTNNVVNTFSELDLISIDLIAKVLKHRPELKVIITPSNLNSYIYLTRLMYLTRSILISKGIATHKIEISYLSKYSKWASNQLLNFNEFKEPKIFLFIF